MISVTLGASKPASSEYWGESHWECPVKYRLLSPFYKRGNEASKIYVFWLRPHESLKSCDLDPDQFNAEDISSVNISQDSY